MEKKRGLILLLALVFMTACGSGGGEKGRSPTDDKALTEAADPSKEPATVRFFCGCDQAFASFVKEQTAKAYPNITLDTILISEQNSIDNVLAAGTSLDLVYYSLGGLYLLKDKALVSDLTPLIGKTKFDMTKLVAGAEETMRSYSAIGTFEYMPFDQKPLALFYNKDLFDKFAVPYPKDGMTWAQATELAKTMTRRSGALDGTQAAFCRRGRSGCVQYNRTFRGRMGDRRPGGAEGDAVFQNRVLRRTGWSMDSAGEWPHVRASGPVRGKDRGSSRIRRRPRHRGSGASGQNRIVGDGFLHGEEHRRVGADVLGTRSYERYSADRLDRRGRGRIYAAAGRSRGARQNRLYPYRHAGRAVGRDDCGGRAVRGSIFAGRVGGLQ